MARHIGIVACSAEGAALCYRTIAAESAERMGEHLHPEMTMHTFPLPVLDSTRLLARAAIREALAE